MKGKASTEVRRSLCDSIRKVTANGDLLTDEQILNPEFLENNVPKHALAFFVNEFGQLHIESCKMIEKVNKDFDLQLRPKQISNDKVINLVSRRVYN